MKLLIYTLSFIFLVQFADARPFRVNQYPHGSEFGCAGCHFNPAGGGPRNSFGQDVESTLNNGNVDWGPALAGMDSDGDGFTNGEELQDPDGSWEIGNDAPGDAELVTAPYDEDDFPTSVLEVPATETLSLNFTSENVFQNQVQFSINTVLQGNVTVKVYNSSGKFVDLVHQGPLSGSMNFVWQGNNTFGNEVMNGMYFITIETANYRLVKKVMKI